MAESVEIRPCRSDDFDAVAEICCRTGYGGRDVASSGVFSDRVLFGLLFCRYYLLYEADLSFVAVNAAGRVVGYVLGCADTERYSRRFALLMIPRILIRIGARTLWRDPPTVRELLRWARGVPWKAANPAGPAFPAHLHMGLLPEAQRQGIGSRLLIHMEARLRDRGVGGIHLVTSNYHRQAIPFYLKHGYTQLLNRGHRMWSGLRDYHSIVFVKRLAP